MSNLSEAELDRILKGNEENERLINDWKASLNTNLEARDIQPQQPRDSAAFNSGQIFKKTDTQPQQPRESTALNTGQVLRTTELQPTPQQPRERAASNSSHEIQPTPKLPRERAESTSAEFKDTQELPQEIVDKMTQMKDTESEFYDSAEDVDDFDDHSVKRSKLRKNEYEWKALAPKKKIFKIKDIYQSEHPLLYPESWKPSRWTESRQCGLNLGETDDNLNPYGCALDSNEVCHGTMCVDLNHLSFDSVLRILDQRYNENDLWFRFNDEQTYHVRNLFKDVTKFVENRGIPSESNLEEKLSQAVRGGQGWGQNLELLAKGFWDFTTVQNGYAYKGNSSTLKNLIKQILYLSFTPPQVKFIAEYLRLGNKDSVSIANFDEYDIIHFRFSREDDDRSWFNFNTSSQDSREGNGSWWPFSRSKDTSFSEYKEGTPWKSSKRQLGSELGLGYEKIPWQSSKSFHDKVDDKLDSESLQLSIVQEIIKEITDINDNDVITVKPEEVKRITKSIHKAVAKVVKNILKGESLSDKVYDIPFEYYHHVSKKTKKVTLHIRGVFRHLTSFLARRNGPNVFHNLDNYTSITEVISDMVELFGTKRCFDVFFEIVKQTHWNLFDFAWKDDDQQFPYNVNMHRGENSFLSNWICAEIFLELVPAHLKVPRDGKSPMEFVSAFPVKTDGSGGLAGCIIKREHLRAFLVKNENLMAQELIQEALKKRFVDPENLSQWDTVETVLWLMYTPLKIPNIQSNLPTVLSQGFHLWAYLKIGEVDDKITDSGDKARNCDIPSSFKYIADNAMCPLHSKLTDEGCCIYEDPNDLPSLGNKAAIAYDTQMDEDDVFFLYEWNLRHKVRMRAMFLSLNSKEESDFLEEKLKESSKNPNTTDNQDALDNQDDNADSEDDNSNNPSSGDDSTGWLTTANVTNVANTARQFTKQRWEDGKEAIKKELSDSRSPNEQHWEVAERRYKEAKEKLFTWSEDDTAVTIVTRFVTNLHDVMNYGIESAVRSQFRSVIGTSFQQQAYFDDNTSVWAQEIKDRDIHEVTRKYAVFLKDTMGTISNARDVVFALLFYIFKHPFTKSLILEYLLSYRGEICRKLSKYVAMAIETSSVDKSFLASLFGGPSELIGRLAKSKDLTNAKIVEAIEKFFKVYETEYGTYIANRGDGSNLSFSDDLRSNTLGWQSTEIPTTEEVQRRAKEVVTLADSLLDQMGTVASQNGKDYFPNSKKELQEMKTLMQTASSSYRARAGKGRHTPLFGKTMLEERAGARMMFAAVQSAGGDSMKQFTADYELITAGYGLVVDTGTLGWGSAIFTRVVTLLYSILKQEMLRSSKTTMRDYLQLKNFELVRDLITLPCFEQVSVPGVKTVDSFYNIPSEQVSTPEARQNFYLGGTTATRISRKNMMKTLLLDYYKEQPESSKTFRLKLETLLEDGDQTREASGYAATDVAIGLGTSVVTVSAFALTGVIACTPIGIGAGLVVAGASFAAGARWEAENQALQPIIEKLMTGDILDIEEMTKAIWNDKLRPFYFTWPEGCQVMDEDKRMVKINHKDIYIHAPLGNQFKETDAALPSHFLLWSPVDGTAENNDLGCLQLQNRLKEQAQAFIAEYPQSNKSNRPYRNKVQQFLVISIESGDDGWRKSIKESLDDYTEYLRTFHDKKKEAIAATTNDTPEPIELNRDAVEEILKN